jgi:UDP-N-acetylmuramoyl-L-alanyl-D-glutamate--2,6-diaminopimelate ligase
MDLRHLIAELPVTRVDGSLDRTISGLAYDSRRVTPGMVFVALPGQHTDGHDYVSDAVARGAVAIVGERAGIAPRRATRITVTDSRLSLALAAAAYHGHPSRRLRVVGITGTSGKTTVAFILKQMLEAAAIRTGLISTICHQIGDRVVPAQRTTPEA